MPLPVLWRNDGTAERREYLITVTPHLPVGPRTTSGLEHYLRRYCCTAISYCHDFLLPREKQHDFQWLFEYDICSMLCYFFFLKEKEREKEMRLGKFGAGPLPKT